MAMESEGLVLNNSTGGELEIVGGQSMEIGTQYTIMWMLPNWDLPPRLSGLASKLAEHTIIDESAVSGIDKVFSAPRTTSECISGLQGVGMVPKSDIIASLQEAESLFVHRWQDRGERKIALASRVSTLQRAAARLSGNPW